MSRRRRGDSSDEYSDDDSDDDADHKRRRHASGSPPPAQAPLGVAAPIPTTTNVMQQQQQQQPGNGAALPHWSSRRDPLDVGQLGQPPQVPPHPRAHPGGSGGGVIAGAGWGGGGGGSGFQHNRLRVPSHYNQQDSVEPYVPQPVFPSGGAGARSAGLMGALSFGDMPAPPPGMGALPLPFMPAMMGGYGLHPPAPPPPAADGRFHGGGSDGGRKMGGAEGRGWARQDGDAGGGQRGGGGRGGRSGRGGGRDSGARATATLFLTNLPPEQRDLDGALRAHFARFGHVAAVRVRFTDGAKGHLGYVQMASGAAAEAALAAPDAILGNRFVHAAWAQRDITPHEGGPPVQPQSAPGGASQGWGQPHSAAMQQFGSLSGPRPPPPRPPPQAAPPRSAPAPAPAPAAAAPSAEATEKMKALASMQETLAKQIAEQKRMLEALARKTAAEKAPAGAVKEGGEPPAGSAPVEEAPASSPVPSPAHVPGRGGAPVARGRGRRGGPVPGRGRGPHGSSWSKLDTRTTTIVRVVELPEGADVEALAAHFAQFGEVVSAEADGPGARITFDTRKQAEAALLQGKRLGEAAMILQWGSASTPPAPPQPPSWAAVKPTTAEPEPVAEAASATPVAASQHEGSALGTPEADKPAPGATDEAVPSGGVVASEEAVVAAPAQGEGTVAAGEAAPSYENGAKAADGDVVVAAEDAAEQADASAAAKEKPAAAELAAPPEAEAPVDVDGGAEQT
eukprot:jgi/Tetstr1/435157/TSEL_002614.t1